jgi:FkbM family methyltransferase
MLDMTRDPRFLQMREINTELTRSPDPSADTIGHQLERSYELLPEPTQPVCVKTIDGFKIVVDPANRPGFIDNDLYRLGSYEPGILRLIKETVLDDETIIDVGANIGAIALFAALVVPRGRVMAFEALPHIADDLRNNIAVNGFTNISVHEVAVGERRGDADIFTNLEERGSSSLLEKSNDARAYDKPRRVPIRPLDDFTHAAGRIAVIKIDVEGYEAKVLEGAQRTIEEHRPLIILEYDPTGDLRGELDERVMALSYDIHTLAFGKHYESAVVPVDQLEALPKNKLSTLVLRPRVST